MLTLHLNHLAKNKPSEETQRPQLCGPWLRPLHHTPLPLPTPIPAPPGGSQPKPSTFVTSSTTGADYQRPRKYGRRPRPARSAQGQDTENPSHRVPHSSTCSYNAATAAGAAGPGATGSQTPGQRPGRQGSTVLTGRQGAYSLGPEHQPPGTRWWWEGAAASLRDSEGGTSGHQC